MPGGHREQSAVREAEAEQLAEANAAVNGDGNAAAGAQSPLMAELRAAALGVGAHQSMLDQADDISELVRNGVPEPEYVDTPALSHRALVYLRSLAIVSGHKKAGKTLVVMNIASDYVADGGHVVYLDLENGGSIIASRLILLGADADDVRDRFHYVAFPKGIDSPDVFRRQLEEIAEAFPEAVVVIDSFRGLFAMLSQPGASINDQTDIENALTR